MQLCILNHGCSSGHSTQWKAPGVRSPQCGTGCPCLCASAGEQAWKSLLGALQLWCPWGSLGSDPVPVQGPAQSRVLGELARRVWLLLPKTSPEALGFWSPSGWAVSLMLYELGTTCGKNWLRRTLCGYSSCKGHTFPFCLNLFALWCFQVVAFYILSRAYCCYWQED